MTAGAAPAVADGRAARWGLFMTVAALTAFELAVASSAIEAQARSTMLCGLLMAKAGLLMAFSLRASLRRPGPRLTLLAIVIAVGFAVVLMAEGAYRAGVR